MEKEILEIKKGFVKQISEYHNYIQRCHYDVPLEVLCLPKTTINILRKSGFKRISDIVGTDLTEIKGLGYSRLAYINARLQQFLPM